MTASLFTHLVTRVTAVLFIGAIGLAIKDHQDFTTTAGIAVFVGGLTLLALFLELLIQFTGHLGETRAKKTREGSRDSP